MRLTVIVNAVHGLGLSSGLWALISDRNLRGKSSVLRLILGALRGDWPEHVKDDVWKWLRSLQVDFSVDGVPYRATLAKDAGAENRLDAQCVLSRPENGHGLPIYDGPPGRHSRLRSTRSFKTNLASGRILPRGRTFCDLPQGAAFWYENSNGLAEISVNQGSASRELGVAVGTAIEIVS